jgi:predicted flap endonuclease-1-like 5' DNA nuclease
MAWLDDIAGEIAPADQARRAWRLPLGAASPLWALFGAAAGTAVAWWWLTRWTRPVNVEAQPPPVVILAEPAGEPGAPAPATPTVADAPASELAAEPAADDLTRLKGVGPKLAAALAGRGVTRFSDIAGWSDEDLAEVDAALALKGRAVREQWVEQARRLAEN